ncbi:Signal transduction histidine kinase [Arthrobacter alpinus]|uniref:histidine kinase n=1 Tax=Arthrobacter alpinus TaxID=656366 RepID=A0A1H5F764_9MICC|nr:histidine kinase [Arthrobacter alpinus]SED99255.1 Signal transduction histidine kinase [Arthrobacter alpinus]
MNIKTLPIGSPWRTVLLVIVVAVADVLLSAISIGLGMDSGSVPDPEHSGIEWIRFAIAPILAPLGAVALIWRHRFPKTVAATTAVLGALSFSFTGFFVALFLLAKRRLDWWVAAVIALSLGVETLVGIEPLTWDVALVGVVGLAAISAWGAYRGQKGRTLDSRMLSLRERAELAEVERAAETERSRLAERHRIAREMHDTLAHRMSLVAVQAAALQVDAPDADTAHAARVIRETAHAALGELREVLGVLREKETAQAPTAPSGIADIPALADQWRQAGVAVEYVPQPGLTTDGIPDAVGRAAFRVAQEGITNVARHAPEARATVTLERYSSESNGPESELRITVVNGPSVSGDAAPGAGRGLIGLAERIRLLAGSLEHGPTTSGFELKARIPFTPQADQQNIEATS